MAGIISSTLSPVSGIVSTTAAAVGLADPVATPEQPATVGGGTTITGDDDSNSISGTSGSDVIYGMGGNDTIFALAGDDYVFGGSGSDVISGGSGNDHLYGSGLTQGADGGDAIDGGDGADYIQGNAGSDTIDGGAGSDRVFSGADDDLVYGGAGNDSLNGNRGNDILYGGDGNDIVRGGQDNDRLFGENGDDRLYGDLGIDTVTGGAGSDVFFFSRSDAPLTSVQTLTDGIDTVTDFTDGQDYLSIGFAPSQVLQGAAQGTVAGALLVAQQLLTGNGRDAVAAVQVGSDTLLFFNNSSGVLGNNTIDLQNVQASTITVQDFYI